MKKTRNIILVIQILVLILMCYSDITGDELINRSAYIIDENSYLLPLLVEEDDFPTDWTMDLEFTKQDYESPDESNNNLVQTAMRYYFGSYGETKIVLHQYIYEYETIEDAENCKIRLLDEMDYHNKEDQILTSIVDYFIDYFPMTKCKKEYEGIDYSCTTLVQNGPLVSKFVVQGFPVESERDKEYAVYSSLSAMYWWNYKFSRFYVDS